jgi:SulP family sulfate permease
MPVQYAVFAGVVLSGLAYFFTASRQVRLVELTPQANGSYREGPAPRRLPDNAITILQVCGSLFYASIDPLFEGLPSSSGAQRPVVILRLRHQDQIGSTFVKLVERYEAQLKAAGGKLVLAGVSLEVKKQLDKTGTTQDILGDEDIFIATELVHQSLEAAVTASNEWLSRG